MEECIGYCMGSSLSYHDLSYYIQETAPFWKCHGHIREKPILQALNGIFKPGMNAILGPTGSGKTTLLDLLAGRMDSRNMAGHVLIDGFKQPKNFKCMTGYVVQDDIIMGTLTVRENIMFSANLRLPETVPCNEKKLMVEATISELGLIHCADTKVGNEFIHGVSGGERKRTNIGMELIISPSVLFLDEPTTGLDASTANAVMLLLHRLSREGRTIIFSLHQPRYSIFRLFDRLTLLSMGHGVYHGPAESALRYFRSIGYNCEEHNNPPDFFLDVINGDTCVMTDNRQHHKNPQETTQVSHSEVFPRLYNMLNDSKPFRENCNPAWSSQHVIPPRLPRICWYTSAFRNTYTDECNMMGLGPMQESQTGNLDNQRAIELAEKFNWSSYNARVMGELDWIVNNYVIQDQAGEFRSTRRGQYATSFATQLVYVSKRTAINLLRNSQASILQIAVMTILACISGVIYWQLEASISTGIQNRIGAFSFLIMNMMFCNIPAVELFIMERVIFMHENAGGYYRVSSYFIAKLLCDVLPMRTIPVLIFSAISHFMTGFQLDAAKFFIYTLNLFLTGMAASSVCFLVSSCVGILAIATLIISFIFVIMMLFGGFLINIGDIVYWLRWLEYISIFRYSLNTLCINELKDMDFCMETKMNTSNQVVKHCEKAGNTYMTTQGTSYQTEWDLWKNELALACITVTCLVLTFVQLWRVKKVK